MRMRKITILLMAICFVTSCNEFDDSEIWDKLNDHEYRIAYLEEVCNKMNADIANLQTIVTAIENNDFIVNAFPLSDGNGYSLTFKSGKSIVVYNGKNGVNGKDGITPIISVMKDVDGIYYWTVNGEWLLVNGEKVRASALDGEKGADGKDGVDGEDGKDGQNGAAGKDGITPQFKIEDDYWYISYDNGKSWEMLGKATGSDGLNGADGDAMFKRVFVENGYVCFELNDGVGTVVRLPLMKDGVLKVELETAGTLSNVLTSEETRTTTSLIVKGRINEKDMQHIQIMSNLYALDLSDACFESIDQFWFKINPYNKDVVNMNLEELVLPRVITTEYVDLSYCLALKKVVVSGEDVAFQSSYGEENIMVLCPNLRTIEYAEGVEACSNKFKWSEDMNTIETIVYPSTMTKIPPTITICADHEDSSPGFLFKVPDVKLVCKAITPPVVDPLYFFGGPDVKFGYDPDKKIYYTDVGASKPYILYYRIELHEDAILFVPKESIELYKTAPLWENFTNIKAIEDI